MHIFHLCQPVTLLSEVLLAPRRRLDLDLDVGDAVGALHVRLARLAPPEALPAEQRDWDVPVFRRKLAFDERSKALG